MQLCLKEKKVTQDLMGPRDQKASVVKMPLVEVGQDPQETKELLVSKVKRVQWEIVDWKEMKGILVQRGILVQLASKVKEELLASREQGVIVEIQAQLVQSEREEVDCQARRVIKE